jgi:hypothetical protein
MMVVCDICEQYIPSEDRGAAIRHLRQDHEIDRHEIRTDLYLFIQYFQIISETSGILRARSSTRGVVT